MPRGRSKTNRTAQETLENGSLPKAEFQAADFHGQRQQLEALQAAAPGTPSAPSSGSGAAGAPPSPPGAAAPIDPFGPSRGGPQLPSNGPVPAEDPDLLLRALYQRYGHPDLLALIHRRAR